MFLTDYFYVPVLVIRSLNGYMYHSLSVVKREFSQYTGEWVEETGESY